MLKAKINIQVLKVDSRLITLFKHLILVRIASYGPQIDQSHGENRLSNIIINNYSMSVRWM